MTGCLAGEGGDPPTFPFVEMAAPTEPVRCPSRHWHVHGLQNIASPKLMHLTQMCKRHPEYLDWLWSSQEITSFGGAGVDGKPSKDA